MHAIVRVDDRNVHYWKPAGDTVFQIAFGGDILTPNGVMVNYNGYVVVADRQGDRIIIRATPEGENNWTTLLRETSGPEFRHFNGVLDGDDLHLYLMEEGSGDAQPLWFNTYRLAGGLTSVTGGDRAGVDFSIYPNPAHEAIYLDLEQRYRGQDQRVRIVNSSGAEVLQTLVRGTSPIVIDELPTGWYTVLVGRGTEVGVNKFFKQ